MSLTLTVAGIAVPFDEDSVSIIRKVDERQRLQVTVLDYLGIYIWQYGTRVLLVDNGTGIYVFEGYLIEDKQNKHKGFPSTLIEHELDTIADRYLADKRTYSRIYTNPTYAGKIVIDHLADVLSQENIVQNYASSYDSLSSDFAQGILTNTVGAANVGTGDLELATSGSTVTIIEDTSAQFATGTLLNVQVSNNTLIPIGTTAIYCSATLLGTLPGSYMAVKIWGGSMTVGSSDTLNYDIWISGTSPSSEVGLDLYFSDGTKMSGASTSDQNSLSGSPFTDLSGYAQNTWYTRNIALGSGLNGKTITAVAIVVAGANVGTYTAYIKNAYLSSQTGNRFFAVGAPVSNVNPPQILQYAGYAITQVFSAVVTVFLANNATRTSTAYSINAVKLLRSSVISWLSSPSTGIAVSVSYDGGVSYFPCINNSALPSLSAGSNVAGLTLILKEAFIAGGTTDPTVFPTLSNVNISLISAPSAVKSDIVQTFSTAANWNTGTYTNTVLSGNNLTLGSVTRNWSDNLVTNQTLFAPSGVSQAASSGVFSITTPNVSDYAFAYGISRLDFCGQLVDFILDVDMSVNSSATSTGIQTSAQPGITYRQACWQATIDNTYAYLVEFYPTVNIPSGGTASGWIHLTTASNAPTNVFPTTLGSYNTNISIGTFYHVKIVVKGTRHQIYFNHSTLPVIDVINSTYLQLGGFGLRQYNQSVQLTGVNVSSVTKYDNLVVQPVQTGTWQSPAVSISSLTTCGPSSIYWTETGTGNQALANILVQTSIDAGSTFQICTNGGAIPNLTSGMTVSGKTIITLVTIDSLSLSYLPVLSQMVWRVLGAYPGSSGSRTTSPLGIDTMVRGNVVGSLGPTFDGQAYTKVGTATVNLTSNEAIISNTTGDLHMLYGSRIWGDKDATLRFSLSPTTINAGIELRYVDANNLYRFSVSTTTLTLLKILQGATSILTTASVALSTNTYYWMRFRVVGSSSVVLMGRVWTVGTLEPTTWAVMGND